MSINVPLTSTEGLQSKDLYILCVMERSCEMQESPSKTPDWHSITRLKLTLKVVPQKKASEVS